MIPQQVQVILLADRGFGRTELARFCQNQGFNGIIRIHKILAAVIAATEEV